jgi:hypothetical protein
MNSLLIKLADSIDPEGVQSPTNAPVSKTSNGTNSAPKDDENEEKSGKEKKPPKEEIAAEPIPQEAAAPVAIDGKVIIDFFKSNPFPADSDFHAFCDQNGIDTSAAESAAYGLATLMVQFLSGGKSGGQVTADQVDPDQLQRGIEVEKEHVDNEIMASKIAIDHLVEIPTYYSYLDEMESQAKQDMGQTEENQGSDEANQIPENKSDGTSKGWQPSAGQGNAFDSMNQTQG